VVIFLLLATARQIRQWKDLLKKMKDYEIVVRYVIEGTALPMVSSGHSLVNYKGDLWLMGVGTLGVGSTNVLVLKLLPGDE
jgi:hypothetical protein